MKIHIAKKGETLWNLAKKYAVNFEQLKKLNSQLSNPDMIMPGMKIKIPGTAKPIKTDAGSGAKITYSAKEAPKGEPLPFIKESVKEAPIAAAPSGAEQPQPVELPQAPPAVTQAAQPDVPEADITNYYMANMAEMSAQVPIQQPVIPEKPKNVLPGLMMEEVKEVPIIEMPKKEVQVKEAPIQEAPIQEAPIEAAPVQEAPPQVEGAAVPAQEQCIPISPVMPGTGYGEPINMPNIPFPTAPMFPQMPFYPQQQFMPEQGTYMQQPCVPEAPETYMQPPVPQQVQGAYMQQPVPQQVQGTYMQQPLPQQVQGMYAQQPFMTHDDGSLFESSSYKGTQQPFPAAGYGQQNYPYYGGQQMPFAQYPGAGQPYAGTFESSSLPYGASSSIPHSMVYGHQMHAGPQWGLPANAPQQVMGQYGEQPSLQAADDCGCGGSQQPIPLHPSAPYYGHAAQTAPQAQGFQELPAGYHQPESFQGSVPQSAGEYYGQQPPGSFPQQGFPTEESSQAGGYGGQGQQDYMPESPSYGQNPYEMMQNQPGYGTQPFGGQYSQPGSSAQPPFGQYNQPGYGEQSYGGQPLGGQHGQPEYGAQPYGSQQGQPGFPAQVYGGQGQPGFPSQYGGQSQPGFPTQQYGGQGQPGFPSQYGDQSQPGFPTQQFGGQGQPGFPSQYGGQSQSGFPTQQFGGQGQPGFPSQGYGSQSQSGFPMQGYGGQVQPGFPPQSHGGQSQPGFPSQSYGGQSQPGFPSQSYGGQSQPGFPAQPYGGQGQPGYGAQPFGTQQQYGAPYGQQPQAMQGETELNPEDMQGYSTAQPDRQQYGNSLDFSQISPFIQQKPFSSSKYADESADYGR
ncbi:morphogenetic protein associated with SpoVID [Peribacillus deserti]|uniref:Morphogenetic protein associated with SpoVID n=1 Tax=Peribacillus deserti TaxID=673318 RepID=A0ABS2QFN4_9BACI|nr:morphogenetic protein associated with SpoVID [Peribacillus deserti]